VHGINFPESTTTDLSFEKAKGQLRLCLRLKARQSASFLYALFISFLS
jgi:hypothetical protein